MQEMIDCHQCEHYYVTWDKDFPHGCRAMGFKSARPPSVTVLINSDKPCLLYEEKIRKKKKS